MKTRAAVAFQAKQPLEIVELDLQGPQAGEVLVEIMATGICHTDAYTLDGYDSEGIFPSVLGHEGAGIVREVGTGVTSVRPGDHVIPLYTPECRQCKSCLSGKTNLCTAIRATQGKGLMPDGTTRFSYKGAPIFHYMGCSTFSNFTVLPEIAVARIRKDAPFKTSCYIGCGVTTGVGAVVNTAKVQVGETVVVFGLGGIGLNVLQGAKIAGASRIVGVDINPDREEWGRRFGMTHFIDGRGKDRAAIIAEVLELTDGGADFTFDCTGNTEVMRTALEACHRGWGTSIIIGVAEAGKEISTRPFQLVTGRNWRGTAFGGAKGRTDVPKIVDWYMNGKIEIDPMITHVLTLEEINKGFDLMHAGESIRSVVVSDNAPRRWGINAALDRLNGGPEIMMLFGAAPGLTGDQWLRNGRRAASDPALASSGGFAIQQIATLDADGLNQRWSQPTPGVLIDSVSTVARDQPIFTYIIFTGCKADKTGACNVTAAFRMFDPEGRPWGTPQDTQIWVSPPPAERILQLSASYLGLVVEDKDALGKYRVAVDVTDHVAGVTLHTEQVLTAVAESMSGHSRR